MAEIRIGAEQFRRQLTDLLNRTSYGRDHIIIERHGTPLGALISFSLYEAMMAAQIPEQLAQLERVAQDEELPDLAAALAALLEGNRTRYPTPEEQQTAEEQLIVQEMNRETQIREVAEAYYLPTRAVGTTGSSTLTLEEAAMYLKLPIDTIARQADQGMLPGRKINNTWRFLRAAIDHWLRNTDGRQILLQQAGAFADDESLTALRTEIYAARGRSEVAADVATATGAT